MSVGILRDLRLACPALRDDLDAGKVGCWLNVKIPFHEGTWDADFVIAEPEESSVEGKAVPHALQADGAARIPGARPDGRSLRLVMEHKSVITAHRNKQNRFKELATDVKYSNDAGYNIVVAATILVGTAQRVMNVVEGVRKRYRVPGTTGQYHDDKFEAEVGSRLRERDQKMWDEFVEFVSYNKPKDATTTAEYFRKNLPERQPDRWNQPGLDALLIVPVYYDNVGEAHVDRVHALGKTFDEDYAAFIHKLHYAYTRRWKPLRR